MEGRIGTRLTKVKTGYPLVIPAQAYKAFINAAKDFHQNTHGKNAGIGIVSHFRNSSVIRSLPRGRNINSGPSAVVTAPP